MDFSENNRFTAGTANYDLINQFLSG